MRLSVWIEVSSSGSAAISIIAKFVNVKAMRAFDEALELPLDNHRSADIGLCKVNDSSGSDCSGHHANCLQCHLLGIITIVILIVQKIPLVDFDSGKQCRV